MNRRGERFLTVRQFTSHASRLKVKSLTNGELEFYERHCLLLPVARTHTPTAHAVALAQKAMGGPVSSPEDLEPSDEWLRLKWGYQDGIHTFDRERGNPLLVIPDCTAFRPWAGDRVAVPIGDGSREVPRGTVERYYAAWQVHVVERLRRDCYYQRAPFLRELPESHSLRKFYGLPEDTEEIRTLGGMAVGYDALTLFGVARRIAFQEAFDPIPAGQSLSESARSELHNLLTHHAQRALSISGIDEPALFDFIDKLTRMIQDYRADERFALAEDAEQYLWEAPEFAYYAFDHDWDGFLDAAKNHVGKPLADRLRRLDPIEATALDAQENLASILQDSLGANITADGDDYKDTPREIVEFCRTHDLYEVLTGLQNYSYSLVEQRRDGYPGFLHRRLRPLALAVEQLARGILDGTPEPPHGKGLREMINIIGANSTWLEQFEDLIGDGETSDKQGVLDRKALALARPIQTFDTEDGRVIAITLVSAVAARNLVSHRHRFLSREVTMTLGGVCANSVVLIWLLAKERGLV